MTDGGERKERRRKGTIDEAETLILICLDNLFRLPRQRESLDSFL